MRGGDAFYVPDLAHDPRWTTYGPRAAELGAASCLSIPIVAPSAAVDPGAAEAVGAPPSSRAVVAVLKIYAVEKDGLTELQRETGGRYADEVTAGLTLAHTLATTAQEVEDRTEAMKTRQLIDMALGVVMERTKCDPGAAFDSLRQLSQHDNVKLTQVARNVLATLPGGGDIDVHFDRAR